MPTFREHQFHFIRARNNLILSCSSEGFSMYSLFNEKGERSKKRGKKDREKSRYCDGSDYFSRLTSRSIFDNRENGFPYSTYVVAVISI